MTAYDDGISRWLLEIAQRQTRNIQGVSVDNAERDGAVIEFNGSGWSPTLHRARLTWTVDLSNLEGVNPSFVEMSCGHDDLDRTKHALGNAADRVADAITALQAPRMRFAHSHGIHQPRRLPRSTSTMTARQMDAEIDLTHVVVDRVTVDLIGRWQRDRGHRATPADVRRAIVECLVDVHSNDLRDGARVWDVDSQERRVRIADCPEGGRVQPDLPFAFPIHVGSARFDGMRLTCGSALPETTLQALPGRPVGDLVATGTALDRRIIAEAIGRGDRGMPYVVVEADDVPLRDIA